MKSDNDTGIITNESLTTHCSGVRDYKLLSLSFGMSHGTIMKSVT